MSKRPRSPSPRATDSTKSNRPHAAAPGAHSPDSSASEAEVGDVLVIEDDANLLVQQRATTPLRHPAAHVSQLTPNPPRAVRSELGHAPLRRAPTLPEALYASADPWEWCAACGLYKAELAELQRVRPKLASLAAPHRAGSNSVSGAHVALGDLDVTVRSTYFHASQLSAMSPEECARRVGDIVLWKLSRGQFRVGLLQKAMSNPPQLVKRTLINAMAKLNAEFVRHSAGVGAPAAHPGGPSGRAATPERQLRAVSGLSSRRSSVAAGTPPATPPPAQSRLRHSQSAPSTPPPPPEQQPRSLSRGPRSSPPPSPLQAALLQRTGTAALGGDSPLRFIRVRDTPSVQQGSADEPLHVGGGALGAAAMPSVAVEERIAAVAAAVHELASQLKGIGPATATAILQQFHLANDERGVCPFFADEAATVVLSVGRGSAKVALKYSEGEVRDFVGGIFRAREALRAHIAHPGDPLPTAAEMSHALWAVAKRHARLRK